MVSPLLENNLPLFEWQSQTPSGLLMVIIWLSGSQSQHIINSIPRIGEQLLRR